MDEVYDWSGSLTVRAPSNTATGKFVLYGADTSDLDSIVDIKHRGNADIESTISIRVEKSNSLETSLNVMYRGNAEIEASILAVSSTYLDASIEIRPHNVMLGGRFELLEAPRNTVELPPLEDATTRSDFRYRTINYGDLRTMEIGKNETEEFESFIHFGQLDKVLPNLLLVEEAKLKLYYSGTISSDAMIKLSLPDSLWSELGITYANRPYPTEVITDTFILNNKEQYIEFDVTGLVIAWKNESIPNYGLIVSSDDETPTYFYARESDKPPILSVRYINNQIYSQGRLELPSTIFIIGVGNKDIDGSITVHSDRGFAPLDASIYVHQPKDPLITEQDGQLVVTRNEALMQLTIAQRKPSDIEASLTARQKLPSDVDSSFMVSTPEKYATITVDPNMSLKATITIAKKVCDKKEAAITVSKPELIGSIRARATKNNDIDSIINVPSKIYLSSNLSISRPQMLGQITISKYKKLETSLDGTILIIGNSESVIESTVMISNPEIGATITIRGLGEQPLDSTLEVPYYDSLDSGISVSKPELTASVLVKYSNNLDSLIEVKERSYLDANIMVKKKNEISATIMIKNVNQLDGQMIINRPELSAVIVPRVIDNKDLSVLASIRRRDAADLECSFIVHGMNNGAFYYIL